MSSRDKILNTIKGNQPAQRPLPPLPGEAGYGEPAAPAPEPTAGTPSTDGPHEPGTAAAATPGTPAPTASATPAESTSSAAEPIAAASTPSANTPAAPAPDPASDPAASTPSADTPTASAAPDPDAPESAPAPDPASDPDALVQKFITVLEAIGGTAYIVSGLSRIVSLLHEEYPDARRIISGVPGLESLGESGQRYPDPHTLENVDVAVLSAHFGVAENGACWITEERMIERALPFIAQNLVLVIRRNDIVADMHEAYSRIEETEAANGAYGFATFIAGPSKTADIEQSLVLGAHGPKSMTVFLLDEEMFDAGFF